MSKTGAPISKYVYGQFLEHIGSLVYRSLWSEMLDDRKFYFPISSKDFDAAARGPVRHFRMLQPRAGVCHGRRWSDLPKLRELQREFPTLYRR